MVAAPRNTRSHPVPGEIGTTEPPLAEVLERAIHKAGSMPTCTTASEIDSGYQVVRRGFHNQLEQQIKRDKRPTDIPHVRTHAIERQGHYCSSSAQDWSARETTHNHCKAHTDAYECHHPTLPPQ